jgi:hypothetical protein
VTWSEFLRSQAVVACDFATIDTVTLRRYYLLFFVDIPTRTVYLGGITELPTGAWTSQAARNLYFATATIWPQRRRSCAIEAASSSTPSTRSSAPSAAPGPETSPLRRAHRRVPKCRLTSRDRVFGTHTQQHSSQASLAPRAA